MAKDDRFIYMTFKAEHYLSNYMKRLFTAEGITISPQQSAVLFILRKAGSLSMSQLSQAIDVDNSAITGIIDRLEKGEFVERKSDPDDRRKYLISITEKGTVEIGRTAALVKKINERIKEGLTDSEVEAVKKFFTLFQEKFR